MSCHSYSVDLNNDTNAEETAFCNAQTTLLICSIVYNPNIQSGQGRILRCLPTGYTHNKF